MTETRCGIHLCDWTFPSNGETAAAALDRHEREDHPTAVRVREGLARWRRIIDKDSAAHPVEARGRGPSAATAAFPESPQREDEPSSGRVSAQTGPRPRRYCVYCGQPPATPTSIVCSGCEELEEAS